MKLSVERLPESRVLLDIAADEDEFAKAMDRAYRRVATQAVIPGFRKGKAPRGIVERMYGREVVVEEAHKQLMTDLYRRVIEQESLVPVGDPEVEVVAAEPLAFKVTLPVYPSIDPGPYAETRIEPIDAAVSETDVDEVVERLRKQQSPWVDPAEGALEVGPDLVLERKARTARPGDQVTIDYAVRDEASGEAFGEPVVDAVFVLGESNLLERMEEEIGRLPVGETAEFGVAFAADDEAVDPERRGKTLAYRVALKGLKERELLPLDDDFARGAAEVETLEELRSEIRDDLRQSKTADARAAAVAKIVDGMAATATIDLPAPMVAEAVEEDLRGFRGQLAQRRASLEEYLRVSGQSEADLREELRPAAAKRLRNSLLLREIARREGVAVDDAEIQTEVDRLVGAAAGAADPAQLTQFYGGDYFRGVLRSDLFERRVTERLIEIATEGRGAVLNGWVEPEPQPEPEPDPEPESETVSGGLGATAAETSGDAAPEPAARGDESRSTTGTVAGGDAIDRALTLGTMPGQPGDLGGAVPATIEGVTADPDAADAAAVGHEAENAVVSGQAADEAITPEEREAQGPPGEGGSLPNPTY